MYIPQNFCRAQSIGLLPIEEKLWILNVPQPFYPSDGVLASFSDRSEHCFAGDLSACYGLNRKVDAINCYTRVWGLSPVRLRRGCHATHRMKQHGFEEDFNV